MVGTSSVFPRGNGDNFGVWWMCITDGPASVRNPRCRWSALGIVLCLLWPCRLPAQEPAAVQPLTLAQAIAKTLADQPSLLAAEGQVSEAAARTGVARAAEGFQVRTESRYTVASTVPSIQISSTGPPVQLGSKTTLLSTLSAVQPLLSGGRLQALVRQASDLTHAAEANRERARQQVVYTVSRAFLLLVAAQREGDVARQTLEAANAHLHAAQLRVEARAAAQFDLTRAQVDVNTARGQVISAETDRQIALDALRQALGVDQGNYQAVEENPPVPVLPPVELALRAAYANRPELRAFGFQLSANTAARDAARAARRPTINLVFNYQLATPSTPVQFTEWTIGLQTEVLWLDAGLTKANVRLADAQRTEILAARAELVNAISADVRDTHARLRAGADQLEVARAQVRDAEETMRIARVRYQGGVGTATEISDAQVTLAQARLGLVQAEINLEMARAELTYAIGTPVPTAPHREARR